MVNMADAGELNRMSLSEHFGELRRCMLRALVGIVAGMAICLVFGDQLIQLMCWPVAVAERVNNMPVRLRVLAPTESFSVYLKVCLIWGAILAAPYSLWQLWKFISAGLYPHEKRYVHRYVPFSVLLFAVGVAFFFVFVAPVGLSYFLGFGKDNFPQPWTSSPLYRNSTPLTPTSQPTTQTATGPTSNPGAGMTLTVLAGDPENPRDGQVWLNAADGQIHYCLDGKIRRLEPATGEFLSTDLTLSFYMTFISTLSLAFGLGFQVPIVVLVLVRTGLVSTQRLKKLRKYVVLVVVVLAGVITPDPSFISQLSLAIPMYLLYELGLFLARGKKSMRDDRPVEAP